MILHLSTFHLEGGAGVAATRLHRALLHSGEDSWMLVPASNDSEEGVVPLADTKWKSRLAFFRFAAERLYFYPQEKDSSIRFAFSPAEIGADICDHPLVKKADIIHLHWINFGFLSMDSLGKLFSLGKPVVWTLHDMWAFTGGCHYSRGCDHYLTHCRYCPYLSKPDLYDISFSQFEQKKEIYQKAKIAMVSPSNWLTGLTKKASLTESIQSLNIPNCLDTNLFKPGNKTEIRKILNLPPDKKLILFAGANTQDQRKGFAYFREAIKINKLSESNTEVLIFGKSNASFETFPVPVHYLGKITEVEHMVQIYNAADMIVVPSLEDNLPNTIMEAMACGTPAVGFATGGIPEMIDHKLNGFISSLKSSFSLAEGINWVLENNTNNGLSVQARQKVMDNYSENVVTAQYRALYDSLLESKIKA
ncbi:glycosyltransferase [Dyadobacter psychrotolerans]|uniref:Glycosyltransferase n=2 Tax=Dyadobacter psychrotolerans TaxID=2541721 RepID=A0A4R5DXR5_9BACT|nr:glycosyltransferase [Dyadobacter psychrotolerans]